MNNVHAIGQATRFKPGDANPARRPGSPPGPRKFTREARAAVAAAFEGIGGQKAFNKWARANQTEFYKFYTRMIPMQVSGKLEVEATAIYREMSDEDLNARIATMLKQLPAETIRTLLPALEHHPSEQEGSPP